MFRISTLIYVVPAILISVTLHEMAHGYVSYKLGDPTPKLDGRLSLNPLRHLDFFGTLALLFAGFGWARPVRVDPSYYKDPKSGMVWTAFAGPLANFLLSFVCIFLLMALLRRQPGLLAGNARRITSMSGFCAMNSCCRC